MRVAAADCLRVRQPDQPEELRAPGLRGSPTTHDPVPDENLRQLPADPKAWVKRCCWILWHDRNGPAANSIELRAASAKQIYAGKLDCSSHDPAVGPSIAEEVISDA